MNREYDFVIVGSGLGGLACAYILSSEGYSVVVLEKNNQIGGNMQVFSRNKSVFETGVHYIGSLDKGENLYQFFKYFGIMDKLKLQRLDEDGFDIIRLKDGSEYPFGQGYERFKKNLYLHFPDEKAVIDRYCEDIKNMCRIFPLYNLEVEDSQSYLHNIDLLEINAYQYFQELTNNETLRNVLAGSNLLYAGIKEKTPFYVHALIMNSYLTGSYRLKDGSSQIAIKLAKAIRHFDGRVLKRVEVTGANYHDDGRLKEVVIENGQTFKGKNFISNIHPAVTMKIFGEDRFLPAYKKRLNKLENSISSFTVHLAFKKNSFEYPNYNIYQYKIDDVWNAVDYDPKDWPQALLMSCAPVSKNCAYADSMSILTYMNDKETEQWTRTFNTVKNKNDRGQTYEQFKKEKEEMVIREVEKRFPDIREKIVAVYSSSPLTFRDYIGSFDGSMYGLVKDSNSYLRSHIHTKTKVPNLFLTGQNVGLHGVLGVTVTAFVTCFNFVDKHKIIQKVRNA